MDKVTEYRTLVFREMQKRASRRAANLPNVVRQLIVDESHSQFLLLTVGWDGPKYVHQCLAHAQIHEGRIHILEDLTDPGLLEAFENQGVPRTDIELDYVSEMERAKLELASV